jgi:hypothetical protein
MQTLLSNLKDYFVYILGGYVFALFLLWYRPKNRKKYPGKAMQWLYNLEIAKIKNYPQSKNEGRVKKCCQYLLARVSKEQRQEKRKRILSVRFIFPLSKHFALYCNLQGSKHISSKSSTLKLIYPQGTFFLYPCNYISAINNLFFYLINQVDIENCWRFSSLSSAVHRKKGLKLKSFQSVNWKISEDNNCWSDWWNFTHLVDRKPWQTCWGLYCKLRRLYAS